jgi:hypothetical protein
MYARNIMYMYQDTLLPHWIRLGHEYPAVSLGNGLPASAIAR